MENKSGHWNLVGLDSGQSAAAAELLPLLDTRCPSGGLTVSCRRGGDGLHVRLDGGEAEITYAKDVLLYRGLGLLAEMLPAGSGEARETPCYDDLGVMLDCSRGAVPTRESYRQFVRRMALMGYTSLQLYTEDTYEVEDYPYFGYLRGRFTMEDLRDMDSYAARFSIELVPCIQTLAHLAYPLRWDAMRGMCDIYDILLAGDEKAYALIDAMMRAMSENVSSRRINIGMDEAHMVGLGRYLDAHGFQDRTRVMLDHLSRVMEIARKYGYRPMMWSDMFFRLACGDYYKADCIVDPAVAASIPEDLTLVYWDYYSEKPETYDSMMKKHRELCPRLAFAGGAWNWIGFSPNSHFSEHVGRMAHESCRENGVRQMMLAIWGDNGAESSRFAVLPAMQLWAEQCYGDAGEAALARRFATCAGSDYSAFMSLDASMLTPDNPSPGGCAVNPPKYLLYQDLLCGIFDRHVDPEGFRAHFATCAQKFGEYRERGDGWGYLFETQYRLCRVLELKCGAGVRIREAYKAGDLPVLYEYADHLLPKLIKRTRKLMKAFKAQWFRENREAGYEVIDLRMGALLQRMQTTIDTLHAYLGGKISRVESLEETLLTYDGSVDGGPLVEYKWENIATYGRISWM